MMDFFIDTAQAAQNKHTEKLCGDFFTSVRGKNMTTMVLSDGLGSGVKANILATLTAKILSTMLANNLTIEESATVVAQTLPVCKVRNMAYSTFSVLQIDDYGDCYMAQFDNPQIIVLRDGKSVQYQSVRKTIEEKEIYESHIKLEYGDMLICVTDGVTAAGLGKLIQDGWQRKNLVLYAEKLWKPGISTQLMASSIIDTSLDLYQGMPDDDSTAVVVGIKERQVVNMLVGPPKNPDDDEKVASLFLSRAGKHVVCGGTSAKIISKYLNRPVQQTDDKGTIKIPAISKIEGIDLVTEGVITLGECATLATQYVDGALGALVVKNKTDGASLLTKMLFESATDINIFVGMAFNPAHSSAAMGIGQSVKIEHLKEIEKHLKKQGKNIKISYC